ncbi:SMP-30/gluconolactonase/LRE family protein [Neorhizobium sp. P12A]|uniref:SMP-30/gluconolactonase/LRE family protein n=1 Tax=Neorhizobium sp. P12A TaxID=2268027 RepID=UPI00165D5AF8|nr:SMP-30/gluconolactonase/LRE family protein [Neorhizobium sp. P12A]
MKAFLFISPSESRAYLRCFAALLLSIACGAGNPVAASAAEGIEATVAKDIGFPEGTIFVGKQIYFVDYLRSNVLRLVDGRSKVIWHRQGCGANGLVQTAGGLIVACFDSGTLVVISLDGKTVTEVDQDQNGQFFEAPNDLAAAKDGNVYFSASGNSGNPGKVFFLKPNRVAVEVETDLGFANGVGLSPDGATFYVADSATGRIVAFSIAPDGSLGSRRDFIRLRDTIPNAKPDSFKVDGHGNLFIALYDGGGLAIVSPDGKLISVLAVPADHHTNVAISPDGASLYVAAVDDNPAISFPGKIIQVSNPIAR